MKKRIICLILVCVLFILIFVSSVIFIEKGGNSVLTGNLIQSYPIVIIDAGHGGVDGGAVAVDGTSEKNINLSIAKKLEALLKFYGFNVIMTRTEDVMTSDSDAVTIRQKKVSDIHNRFKIIENNPDSIFISVHQNKFDDSSQWGTQVFYSGNNPNSKILAQSIQDSIVNTIQKNNKRVVKKTGTEIYLLYHAQSPAVLVECGFISNYNDLKMLKTEEYQSKIAMLIADGILKYSFNG